MLPWWSPARKDSPVVLNAAWRKRTLTCWAVRTTVNSTLWKDKHHTQKENRKEGGKKGKSWWPPYYINCVNLTCCSLPFFFLTQLLFVTYSNCHDIKLIQFRQSQQTSAIPCWHGSGRPTNNKNWSIDRNFIHSMREIRFACSIPKLLL